MKKKWTFKQPPRFLITYEELSITSADYDGKHVDYYCYNSKAYGSLRLNFNADGSVSSKFNLNSEMKKMCEKFIAAR